MTPSVLRAPPDRIERPDVRVMQRTTVDDLPHIQAVWPPFEALVGLRGRAMYAVVRPAEATYTDCTPVRPDAGPAALGLEGATLPGGAYLRGSLSGEPPQVYGLIGAAMTEVEQAAPSIDVTRPLVEFYRRHDQIELWVPVPGG